MRHVTSLVLMVMVMLSGMASAYAADNDYHEISFSVNEAESYLDFKTPDGTFRVELQMHPEGCECQWHANIAGLYGGFQQVNKEKDGVITITEYFSPGDGSTVNLKFSTTVDGKIGRWVFFYRPHDCGPDLKENTRKIKTEIVIDALQAGTGVWVGEAIWWKVDAPSAKAAEFKTALQALAKVAVRLKK